MTTSTSGDAQQQHSGSGSCGGDETILDLSSDMEFYAQHDAKMMSSIYELDYSNLAGSEGGGNTDTLLNLSICTANKDEDENRLFEEFISLVVDKSLEPSNFGSQPSLAASQETNCHQQQVGAGLHQSSSCSSLCNLASQQPPDEENMLPGQKRLLYASVGLGVGGSRVQNVGPRAARLNIRRDNSLLRQQLQGQLSPVQYRRGQQESCQCALCGKILSAKCILRTCLKSDEVLCTTCGRELTTKCILGSCTL